MNALAKVGLTPERARVAAALLGKVLTGRRGLPAEAVQRMYADYQRLGSTYKVARVYGRSRQAIHEMFQRRGLKLHPDSHARRGAVREWNGRLFTKSRLGWRETGGPRAWLSRLIWEQAHGPVPAGGGVSFKNGDQDDLRLENLFCGTKSEITRRHFRRLHPGLAALTPEARHARKKKIALKRYYRLREQFWREGRRSDGRPMVRPLRRHGIFAQPKWFSPAALQPDPPKPKPALEASSGPRLSQVETEWRKFRAEQARGD